MPLSDNERWLLNASERARDYLAELSSGQRRFGSMYQDISIARDLAAAIDAVKLEHNTRRMLAETRF
jgi:hypothetical protein